MLVLIICLLLSFSLDIDANSSNRPNVCELVDSDEFGLPAPPCICSYEKECAEDEYCQIARGDDINYCLKKYCTGDKTDAPMCICGDKRCSHKEDCKKVGDKLQCVEKPKLCTKVKKDKLGLPTRPCFCSWGVECKEDEYCSIVKGYSIGSCERLYCTGNPDKDSPACICDDKRCEDNQYCKYIDGKFECDEKISM